MAKKVFVDVYDEIEGANIASNITLQEAADIVGIKYCSIVGKVNDRRLIQGRYLIKEVVNKGNTSDGRLTSDEWADEWNLIREGAKLLKSKKGYIKTFSDGKKRVVPYKL